MKIILSEKQLDSLLAESPENMARVLSACKKLSTLDDAQLECYYPKADDPAVLHDIVADVKKRAERSRRRRERYYLRKQLQLKQEQANANRVIDVISPSHTHDDLMQAAKRFCYDLRMAIAETYPDPRRLSVYYRYLVSNFAYIVRFEQRITARMRSYGIKRTLHDRFPDELSDLYINPHYDLSRPCYVG